MCNILAQICRSDLLQALLVNSTFPHNLHQGAALLLRFVPRLWGLAINTKNGHSPAPAHM